MIYFILSIFVGVGALIFFYFSRTMGLPAKLTEAEEFIKKGEPKKASEILKKVLEVEPGHPKARFLLAECYFQSNQHVLAIAEYKKILSNSDWKQFLKESEIHYKLADVYHIMKDWGKEVNEYKIIQNLDPNDPLANKKMGLVYFEQKDYKNAYKSLLKTLEYHAEDFECYFPFAVSAFEIGARAESQNYLEKILQSDPNSFEAHYYLGLINIHEEKLAKASEHLEKAAESPEYRDDAMINLGKLYSNNGNWQKAIEVLQRLPISDDRDILDAHYDLAHAHEKLGNIKSALEVWSSINEIGSNYRNVLEKIEQYHELSKSSSITWFFSLTPDRTNEFLKLMFSRMNLYVAKSDKIQDQYYRLIGFRNKRQLDLPIYIEVHKSTKMITEIAMHDFIKRMEEEKSSEGYFLSTTKISDRALKIIEGRQITLISDEDFSKRINTLMKEFEAQSDDPACGFE